MAGQKVGCRSMKLRIGQKLFLAMFVTTGLGVAVMVLAQRYTFERGFLEYVQEIELDRLQRISEGLVDRYAANGSWSYIAGSKQWPIELIRRGRPDFTDRQRDRRLILGAGQGRLTERPFGNQTATPIAPLWGRVGLLDARGQWLAGALLSEDAARRELRSDGTVIGYLTLAPLKTLSDELDLHFARQQLREASLAAIVVFIGAALAAAILARSFGAPIRALTSGAHALARGQYESRLQLGREDELGRLAEDFNNLAEVLERSRQARQQWVADISHELRTPIAVLQAELEALEDGLRPLNGDALQSFGIEVKRLRLLVDDLHQLAQSDSGTLTVERDTVDLAALLEETVDRFRERLSTRCLSMEFTAQEILPVFADPDRLRQLFANLMENALRYTDPSGTIRVEAAALNDHIQITIEDSAPGVPEEALPQLFDRLYRVDPSRSRETGASGLGLAICESIVKAHGGEMRARHSSLGGLAIDVVLPIHRGGE